MGGLLHTTRLSLALAVQGCSLVLSGSTRSFDRCLALDHLGSNANLMWTVSGDGQQISWGLNTTTDGYVGVGFPTEDDDNVMVGTNAFILQPCEGCSTGVRAAGTPLLC